MDVAGTIGQDHGGRRAGKARRSMLLQVVSGRTKHKNMDREGGGGGASPKSPGASDSEPLSPGTSAASGVGASRSRRSRFGASLRLAMRMVEAVAPTRLPVLLLGETGVGKERMASLVHALSNRRSRLMVVVNCASLPAAIAESELFGHERGAFTGADRQTTGRFG